jgi:ABC-type dipeptide/oligopeptide/nickel transport system permease component
VGRFSFLGPRLVQLIPVSIGITIAVFFMIHAIPGDPAVVLLGSHYTPQAGEAIRNSLGLNQPLWTQYLIFMRNLVHGNLGNSIFYDDTVLSVVLDRLPATLFLVCYAAILAALIAIPSAVFAALHKDGIFDQTVRAILLIAYGMPPFWIGIIFILVFSLHLRIFPVSGYGLSFLDHIRYLFLPALTISLSFSTNLVRTLRNSVLAVLRAEYVDTARIKGISRFAVLRGHILRNALLSVVTVFGINLAFLISGTVVIENIFAIPGLGQLLVSSITQRDYPMVEGEALIFAFLVISINLLTDVAYAVLDPRVTYE